MNLEFSLNKQNKASRFKRVGDFLLEVLVGRKSIYTFVPVFLKDSENSVSSIYKEIGSSCPPVGGSGSLRGLFLVVISDTPINADTTSISPLYGHSCEGRNPDRYQRM
ncbi:MAG: hypothetical protein ABJF72_07440 [Balneola sp.]